MDKQKVFDLVCDHLLTQNEKSMKVDPRMESYGPICSYRGENGLKCAIGALIKDEFYDPELEDQTPYCSQVQTALVESHPDLFSYEDFELPSEDNARFLGQLQKIHDEEPPCSSWPSALKDFANRHLLEFNHDV